MTSSAFANLDGLIALSRRPGVDVRPILISVVTDLYVQHASLHSAGDERQFTELVLGLLDVVDASARASVARRLSTYAQSPRALVQKLARDEIAIAEPILKFSPCLTDHDLVAIAATCGPAHRLAVEKRRAVFGAAPAVEPRKLALPNPAMALPASPNKSSSAPHDSRPAIGDFFAADAMERRRILANLERSFAAVAATLNVDSLASIAQLEAAAMNNRADDFAHHVERALGLSRERALTIATDDGGEALVIVARALAMEQPIFVRILLCLNQRIAQSIARVFGLVKLHEQTTRETALRLVHLWREQKAVRAPRYHPVTWSDERVRARRTASEHPPRGIAGAREAGMNCLQRKT